MKHNSSTSESISNAVLATRYLALQELREQVRKAEERLTPTRSKKVTILPATTKLGVERFQRIRD
jgi:hypothetical protein